MGNCAGGFAVWEINSDFLRFPKQQDQVPDWAGQDIAFRVGNHNLKFDRVWSEKKQTAAGDVTGDGAREKGVPFLIGHHICCSADITDLTEDIRRIGETCKKILLQERKKLLCWFRMKGSLKSSERSAPFFFQMMRLTDGGRKSQH